MYDIIMRDGMAVNSIELGEESLDRLRKCMNQGIVVQLELAEGPIFINTKHVLLVKKAAPQREGDFTLEG